MNELALFAGAGGGILGGILLGWRTVCAVEYEPHAAAILAKRQNDGFLHPFPIWDDVCTFDGKPWRGIVDVVSGGFPCQDISSAGKGKGIKGEKSGLWKEMFRIICEVRPRYAFVENSPMLTSRGLDELLLDLASMGYDAKWGVLGACHAGGVHIGQRLWLVATSNQNNGFSNGTIQARCHKKSNLRSRSRWPAIQDADKAWLLSNSFIVPADYGMAKFVDEFERIGNGQVPGVVKLAWEILTGSNV